MTFRYAQVSRFTQSRRPATRQSPSTAKANNPLQSQMISKSGAASPEMILRLQQQSGNQAVQRLLSSERSVQRKAAGRNGGELDADLHSKIESARGGGQTLDQQAASSFGERLGADFSRVHIHTDAQADTLSRSLNATAFTTSNDIFFAKGAYNPSSPSGQRLLAHELTHVVQQCGSKANKVQTKLRVGATNDKFEQEASTVETQAGPFTSLHQAPTTIQRYTVIKPDDYKRGVVGEREYKEQMRREMFPKQKLVNEVEQNEQDERTYRVGYRQGYFEERPPLRVSENGMLAIEDTTDQPKVFYGERGLVDKAADRLEDIDSRITLQPISGKMLKVPRNPKTLLGGMQKLVMVKPVTVNPSDKELMTANECNIVANSIINGKLIQLGSGFKGETLSDFDPHVTGGRLGEGIAESDENTTETSFAKTYNTKPQISIAITDKFSGVKINDKVLMALSRPGVTKEIVSEVHTTYLEAQKFNQTMPNTKATLDWIEMQRTIPLNQQVNQKLSESSLSKELGINDKTAPEVGEAFSISGIGSEIPIVDERKVYVGNFDTTTGGEEQKQVLENVKDFRLSKYVQDVLQAAGMLEGLHQKLFKNFKKGLIYQEHHASVVAKDGGDSVAFENFSRSKERLFLLEKLWEKLAQDFKKFPKRIKNQVKSIEKNNELDALGKMRQIRDIKTKDLKHLKNALVNMQDSTVKVQLKWNLDNYNVHNKRWFFSMYGSEKAQSFHEVWSPSVTNPITTRTTGKVDPGRVEQFKQEIWQAIKNKTGLVGLDPNKVKQLKKIYKQALNDLDLQKTRTGASHVYRDALAAIKEV